MILIIQTIGFDPETDLQLFVEKCLQMLLRLPVEIKEIRVTIGEGDTRTGKPKFCRINIHTSYAGYHIEQYGNSFEEAVLSAVRELETKLY